MFLRLVNATLIVTYLLILFGVATRVADAGMSCPDWPTCYGVWIPFPAEKFTTEYTNLQIFLEWFHRLLASVAGLMIGACAILSLKYRRRIKVFGVLAGVTVILQIFIGMVTIQYSNEPWTVVVHLGNAMIVFGALVLLRKALVLETVTAEKITTQPLFTALIWLFTVVVYTTMIVGALVSTSHVGGVCGGLFSCLGTFLPEDPGQQLHMLHRLFALLTILTVVALFIASRREQQPFQKTGMGLLVLTIIQALLGIATLDSFSHFPAAYYKLSVMHLAWGTLLWMACLGALAKRHWGVGGGFHGSSS